MAGAKSTRIRNGLLAALPAEEFDNLQAHLRFVELPRRKVLELPNRDIKQIFFLESGIASVVAEGGKKGDEVEVGIIGREGMTGLVVVLGDDRYPYSCYMQVAGAGHVVDADAVRALMQRNPECQRIFTNFVQSFLLQVSETAVANTRARIEERLARWLLMASDRTDDDVIPLTHEFLSLMMGARRPGVTEAVHALARKGLIASRRGSFTILNRGGLMKHAARYYGLPENEYRRLLKAK